MSLHSDSMSKTSGGMETTMLSLPEGVSLLRIVALSARSFPNDACDTVSTKSSAWPTTSFAKLKIFSQSMTVLLPSL